MNRLTIRTYPRLHLSLLGMSKDGYRINGGAGLSISNPQLTLSFERFSGIQITDERTTPMTTEEQTRWIRLVDNCRKINKLKLGFKCRVLGYVFPHVGLGSNTMIYLASIEALFILNNVEYTPDDVVKWSKRGGASGIGINTYFLGGYVFDVGVKNERQKILPSSQQENVHNIPLLMKHIAVPGWQLGLCLPPLNLRRTELEELDFFASYSKQIRKDDVLRPLYEVVYGITSAIIEEDYDVFCKSINKLQNAKWKRAECEQYGDIVKKIEKFISQNGADCVGMSSFGPLVYFLSRNVDDVIQKISVAFPNVVSMHCVMNNQPREIIYD